MTPRERVLRLESLLERIQRNRALPRVPREAASLDGNAAPIPLVAKAVSAAAPAPPPPPPESPPSLKTAPLPGPPATAEPAPVFESRPSSIPPEELSDEDLVEVTTIPPAPEPTTAAPPERPAATAQSEEAPEVTSHDEEEEAPASSRRSKVAESLDQAIASAADTGDEREVPIHTPPPESGPQEAVLPVGLESPRTPDFSELATGDEPRAASHAPTPEQLGETIELEEGAGPEIEIDVAGAAAAEPVAERPVDELEVSLPRAELPSGTYDVSGSAHPDLAPAAAPSSPPPAALAAAPERTARPEVAEAEVTHVIRMRDKAPETFVELIDASLAL